MREFISSCTREVETPFGPARAVSHGDMAVLMDARDGRSEGDKPGITINRVEYTFRFDVKYNAETDTWEHVDNYVHLARVGSYKMYDYTWAARTKCLTLVGWFDAYLKANPDFVKEGARIYLNNAIQSAEADLKVARIKFHEAEENLTNLLIKEKELTS